MPEIHGSHDARPAGALLLRLLLLPVGVLDHERDLLLPALLEVKHLCEGGCGCVWVRECE